MRARRRHDHWELRASDADRDHVAELLGEHCAAGRLTLEELEARLDEAYRARTYRELAAVTRALPRLERRPAARPLPVRRHVLANLAVMFGWLVLTTPTLSDPGFPLPLVTALASGTLLTSRAWERRRRARAEGPGRWRVVPADGWRPGLTPPPWRSGAVHHLAGWAVEWHRGTHLQRPRLLR
jgi:hypothetical protein